MVAASSWRLFIYSTIILHSLSAPTVSMHCIGLGKSSTVASPPQCQYRTAFIVASPPECQYALHSPSSQVLQSQAPQCQLKNFARDSDFSSGTFWTPRSPLRNIPEWITHCIHCRKFPQCQYHCIHSSPPPSNLHSVNNALHSLVLHSVRTTHCTPSSQVRDSFFDTVNNCMAASSSAASSYTVNNTVWRCLLRLLFIYSQ